MFVRITTVHVPDGGWSAYEVAAQKLTLEGSPHAQGRVATWLIQSIEDVNSGISIQVWDSKEALKSYEESGWFTSRVVPTLELLLVGEYPVTRGEVRFVHESNRGWVVRRPRW